MEQDVRQINDLVAKEALFVEQVLGEIRKVIVGQKALLDRLLIGLLADGHVLLEGVPGLAKTLAVKTLADVIDAKFQRIQFTPDLLPADLIGTLIYNQRDGQFVGAQGPDLRQHHPRRRDQPRPGQGAVRAARGDAGAPGHDRRHDLPAGRAVPRAGDAEPDRAGGHLPAARGAGRPLHAQGQGRLPDQGRRSARSSTGWPAVERPAGAEAWSSRPTSCGARGVVRRRSTSTTRIKDYIVDLVVATREPEEHKLDLKAAHRVRRLAARHHLPDAGREGARVPPRPRLRHPGGRQGDRARRPAAPRHPHLRGRGGGRHDRAASSDACSTPIEVP